MRVSTEEYEMVLQEEMDDAERHVDILFGIDFD